MDEKSFEKNKIILKYQNYNTIRYLQHLSKSFIPNLSIIDLLANMGSESGKLLKESNWVFNYELVLQSNFFLERKWNDPDARGV